MKQHRLCLEHQNRKDCNIDDPKCAYREAEKPEQRRLNVHIIDPNVMEQGGMTNTRQDLHANKCRHTLPKGSG